MKTRLIRGQWSVPPLMNILSHFVLLMALYWGPSYSFSSLLNIQKWVVRYPIFAPWTVLLLEVSSGELAASTKTGKHADECNVFTIVIWSINRTLPNESLDVGKWIWSNFRGGSSYWPRRFPRGVNKREKFHARGIWSQICWVSDYEVVPFILCRELRNQLGRTKH